MLKVNYEDLSLWNQRGIIVCSVIDDFGVDQLGIDDSYATQYPELVHIQKTTDAEFKATVQTQEVVISSLLEQVAALTLASMGV